MSQIAHDELARVLGGAAPRADAEWKKVLDQAQPYCPDTVKRHPNPPKDRKEAVATGNACLAEMDPITRSFARPRIQQGIDQAFPQKKGN